MKVFIMRKSHDKGNQINPAATNLIDGNGISERDSMLQKFAREADLSLKDAQAVISGDSAGINQNKVAAFDDAVAAEYGDLDTFQITYESMAPEEL